MKRIFLSLLLAAATLLPAAAMSYRQAREYAYFLTDKMAYELNLTPEQYERCYEVNLDYLLAVDDRYDIFSHYWTFRDTDLRYILFDWQYALYSAADYFYRPVTWVSNSFVFGIYTRYRHHESFYYDRPAVYLEYRGSRWAQRRPGTVSPYCGMVFSGRRGGMRESYSPHASYGYDYPAAQRYGSTYDPAPAYRPDRYNNTPAARHYDNSNYRYEGSTYRSGGTNGGTRSNDHFRSRGGDFDSSTIVRGHRGNSSSTPGSSFPSRSGSSAGSVGNHWQAGSAPAAPTRSATPPAAGAGNSSTRTVGGVQIIGGRR